MKQLTFATKLGVTGMIGAALFVAVGSHRVLGQQSATEEAKAGDPQLKLSPEKTLQKFEPDANEQYELGPGDEIVLDFPGRPELGGKKMVGPDGRITLSLVGPIDVANKTRADVAKIVVAALLNYYQDISVTVDVDKYGSNKIVLIGSVKFPGVQYYDTMPTLLDVIARGGLLASSTGGATSGGAASASERDGIPSRCAIYRGNDQVVWVDLKTMLQSGNSMADMRLRRNDIVFVPSEQDVFVSVLGNVSHPGAIALRPESTLVSILAQAGGTSEGASGKIQVIQPSTGKTSTVTFKSLLTVKGSDEVRLHAGDVIWVPSSAFYKTTYIIQRLSPGATMGMAAVVAK